MGTITTSKTDISFENLEKNIQILSRLGEKTQDDIDKKIDRINGLLDANIGSTSNDLKELNTYISDMQNELFVLISQTETSMVNIITMFADEDEKAAEILSGINSREDKKDSDKLSGLRKKVNKNVDKFLSGLKTNEDKKNV